MQRRSINFSLGKELYQKERKYGDIIKSPRKFGVEFEMVPDKKVHKTMLLMAKLHEKTSDLIPDAWGNGLDGSLSDRDNGVEVQTAPMMLKIGEDTIKKFCKDMSNLGWITDRSCGIHVHLDAADIKSSPELVRRLFLLYFVMDYTILAMVSLERRSNIYCAPLDATKARNLLRWQNRQYDKGFAIEKIISSQPTRKDFLEMFYKKSMDQMPSELANHYNEARYHGINFHPLYSSFGTVEVRYLEGTFDYDTILKWTAFHQHIVDSARMIREVEAIELFHIKGPKTRLRRFADMTNMPEYLVAFAEERIDKYKVTKK